MVKEREATDWEKEWIRQEIESAVAREATAEEIDGVRRALVELLGLSYPQVKAIAAWKIRPDQDKLVLESTKVVNKLADVKQGQPTEKDNANPSIINQIAEPLPVNTPSEDNAIVNDSRISFHPKSGAWMDFENSPIKDIWRKAEAQFIDENLPRDPKKRAKMRVLCTPGIKCYKEVDHLIGIGIRPENIVAVEREKGAWNEFVANCKDKGIKPIYGDLSDVLEETNEPFDIVTLDFLGQLCAPSIGIIHKLPLADKAVLAVNFLAKRESAKIQDDLTKLKRAYGPLSRLVAEKVNALIQSVLGNNPDLEGMGPNEVLKLGRKEAKAEINDTEYEVDELREISLWSLMRHAGTSRKENWMFREMIQTCNFPEEWLRKNKGKDRDQILLHLIANSLGNTFAADDQELLAHLVGHGIYRMDGHKYGLDALALTTNAGIRQMRKLQKFKYKSRIGKTSSPFYANMAVLEKGDYKEFKNTAKFVMKPVVNCIDEGSRGLNTDFQFYFSKKRRESHVIRRADDIIWIRKDLNRKYGIFNPLKGYNGDEIARINVGRLADEVTQFNKYMTSNRFNDPQFAESIPRELLEL